MFGWFTFNFDEERLLHFLEGGPLESIIRDLIGGEEAPTTESIKVIAWILTGIESEEEAGGCLDTHWARTNISSQVDLSRDSDRASIPLGGNGDQVEIPRDEKEEERKNKAKCKPNQGRPPLDPLALFLLSLA